MADQFLASQVNGWNGDDVSTQYFIGSSLGVMQGRLSPMVFGGYQAFPTDLWELEFELAASRGLQHIEWVLDTPSLTRNPILTDADKILSLVQTSGVRVLSVCADFLMDEPLDVALPSSWRLVDSLLDSMSVLGATRLVIPCVDRSSVIDQVSRERLKKALNSLLPLLGTCDVQISLETDLPPYEFNELLLGFDPVLVGVNYDIGNSACLGYDPLEELNLYGARINLLHVKDRVRGGDSVPLGSGSAKLKTVLSGLLDLKFADPVTLQCFRDKSGVAVLDEQLAFYHNLVQEITRGS